jgi:hypothetical protein
LPKPIIIDLKTRIQFSSTTQDSGLKTNAPHIIKKIKRYYKHQKQEQKPQENRKKETTGRQCTRKKMLCILSD